MSDKKIDQDEIFKKLVLEEEGKGNVVFMTIEGPMKAPLSEFIKQPAYGILYDLNRDRATVLTMIKKDKKWVNDFAVSLVINELKRQLDAKNKEGGE
jgi:hypothetical protein